MPAYSYLTATDRAIDRDANEMLSPRANGSGASYLAQGYANMDVLPEQMALADMLERRQTLSLRSRAGRKEQAEEDSLMADQDELSGYSDFVRGTAGMNETDRAAAMRDRALTNPSELSNPLINKSRVVMLAGDRAVLEAKENTPKSKQADLDMPAVNYDDAQFEEKAKLQDLEFGNARDKARLTQEQIQLSRHAIEQGQLSEAGKNIFGLNAFSDEEKPYRDQLIKTVAQLSAEKDDPQSKETIRSLTDIAGGIATGNRVSELKSHLAGKNANIIRYVANTAKIDLSNLPKDRAQRDAAILAAHDAVVKQGNPQALQEFTGYIEKVKSYNDSEEALGTLKNDFFQSLDKIDKLRKSTDPAAKQELKDEMALLNAKASFQGAHFDREYQVIEEDQKRRDKESEIAKRQADVVFRLKSANLAEKRVANAQYIAMMREKRMVAGDRFDRIQEANKVIEDQGQEALGLKDDASVEQIMKKFDELAPPVGAGSSTKDY